MGLLWLDTSGAAFFYEGRSGIAGEILQGTLDAGGVKIEQPTLIRQVVVQSAVPGTGNDQKVYTKWRQIQCLNCGLWTCSSLDSWNESLGSAVPRNTILLSNKIVLQSAWEELLKSPDYSPVFRFVIRRTRPEGIPDGDGLTAFVATLDNQIERYLRQEELNVEEKIRQYVETQRKQFEAVKENVFRDRSRLLSVWKIAEPETGIFLDLTSGVNPLFETSMSASTVRTGAAPVPADLTPPMTPKDMNKSDDHDQDHDHDHENEADAGPHSDSLGPLPSPSALLERTDLGARSKGMRRRGAARLACSLDAEGIFSLEGMDESDSETSVKGHGHHHGHEEDDDDDDPTEGDSVFTVGIPGVPQQHQGVVAHSLPINIAMPPMARRFTYETLEGGDMDTDTEADSVPPQNIAESIKALARSVHMTSDEDQFLMELPRPRLRSFKDAF